MVLFQILLLITSCSAQPIIDGIISDVEWPVSSILPYSENSTWFVDWDNGLYIGFNTSVFSLSHLVVALEIHPNPQELNTSDGLQSFNLPITTFGFYANLIFSCSDIDDILNYACKLSEYNESNGEFQQIPNDPFNVSLTESSMEFMIPSSVFPTGTTVRFYFTGQLLNNVSEILGGSAPMANTTFYGFVTDAVYQPGWPMNLLSYPYITNSSSTNYWMNLTTWMDQIVPIDFTYEQVYSNVIVTPGTELILSSSNYVRVAHLSLASGASLTFENGSWIDIGSDVPTFQSILRLNGDFSADLESIVSLWAPTKVTSDNTSWIIDFGLLHLSAFNSNPIIEIDMDYRIMTSLVMQSPCTLTRVPLYLNANMTVGLNSEWVLANYTDSDPYNVYIDSGVSVTAELNANEFLRVRNDMYISPTAQLTFIDVFGYYSGLIVERDLIVEPGGTLELLNNIWVYVGGEITYTQGVHCQNNLSRLIVQNTPWPIVLVNGLGLGSVFNGNSVEISRSTLFAFEPENLSEWTIDGWYNGNWENFASCLGSPNCTIDVMNDTIYFVVTHNPTNCVTYLGFQVVPIDESDDESTQLVSSNKKSIGIIIGAVIAGAIIITIGALVAFFIMRRKRKVHHRHKTNDVELSAKPSEIGGRASTVTPPAETNERRNTRRNDSWEIDYSELKLGTELGRGAFGVVYQCRWRNTDCVVKQLDINQTDEHSVKKFLKEANNVKNLRGHPNVCTVFGVCTSPKYPICIVMEYLSEGSLDTIIYKNKIDMDAQILLEFAKDTASGMSHLHAENVLHCDLACRNLLVTVKSHNKYQIKIADFGLSRVTETDTYNATTSTSFPVRWTAPETLKEGSISKASDIWSFGVVIWEMAEGKRPYPEMSNTQVISAVCDKGYRLPSPERIPVPDDLYKLMLACWNTNPSQRPSFNQIYDELCQIQEKFTKNETPSQVANRDNQPVTNSNEYNNINTAHEQAVSFMTEYNEGTNLYGNNNNV